MTDNLTPECPRGGLCLPGCPIAEATQDRIKKRPDEKDDRMVENLYQGRPDAQRAKEKRQDRINRENTKEFVRKRGLGCRRAP